MAYTTHRMHTLADGHVIALMDNGHGGYQVQLGLTDRTILNCRTGESVPITTHGCVWCDRYLDKAEEAYDLLTRCNTIRQADVQGYRWWREHMEHIING